jgi:hypothetical protein
MRPTKRDAEAGARLAGDLHAGREDEWQSGRSGSQLRQDQRVVRTGARANALERSLTRLGYRPRLRPRGPRTSDLSSDGVDQVRAVYRALGGIIDQPQFRPGKWDLAFEGGLFVELDEELHFNRYRRVTLEPDWTATLPWRSDYLKFSEAHERDCVAAALWGKRWTNRSCEAMFGDPDPPGVFGAGGGPRWKQRALYDAMKDAWALEAVHYRVARLATGDVIDGVRLGDALDGRAEVDLECLRRLLTTRITATAG